MGDCLPCAVRSVAEVRALMEEALAVCALRSMTLVPRTVSQVSVVIPTPRRGGTVMVEAGPSPLGLCPVRGVSEVEQDSEISRSSSEDKRGRHPSRSLRELVDFTVDDFTAVSHTTNSIFFTSEHPYIPGWVLIRASRDQD